MTKIRITKKERDLIASTPQGECWICDEIANNIKRDERGYYIDKKWLESEGFVPHFEQLIRRKLKDVV